MHNFASIEEFNRYRTVTYYTIRREDGTSSETGDFFQRMAKESNHIRQLIRLAVWIEKIGSNYRGAIISLFRPEGICYALPPNAKYLNKEIDLRLYCHWISEQIVILYNGGIKTARTAQECPNVSRHFYNAQSWTKQLQAIGIEHEGRLIKNIEELYIKY